VSRAAAAATACFAVFSALASPVVAQDPGREVYMARCTWCHGDEGRGDGPSTTGVLPRGPMVPRPVDFVRADYKIRSTPGGQLPTGEDLVRVIQRGIPGTPMAGWEDILTEAEIESLVTYLESLSPRFGEEDREPVGPPPAGQGSIERGEEVYSRARCFMCHGEAGRGDGGITTALNFQWGLPYPARDLTRGWTFKGGHEPEDIYLRITTGMSGTPMGPYQELLSDQERWDLAHYVASLDEEPSEASDDFVVAAAYIDGDIPDSHEAAAWQRARPAVVPLGGLLVQEWWIPTSGTVTVRALWNGAQIAFLLEWNDPTGPGDSLPDEASIRLAARDDSKPHYINGDVDNPVKNWLWVEGDTVAEWTAAQVAEGQPGIEGDVPSFVAYASWSEGRWNAIFRRALAGAPGFEPGKFVPIMFWIRDGAQGRVGSASSTWLYTTLEQPRSLRPWLSALAWILGTVLVQLWIVRRLQS